MDLPLDIVDFRLRPPPGSLRRTSYRPLVIGTTWLKRRTPDDRWLVRVSGDGRLWPLETRPQERNCPGAVLGWILLTPADAGHVLRWRRTTAGPCVGQLLGWCLLYQPRWIHGWAVVDAGPPESGLPAIFEIPGELFDRVDFLTARGIRSRPLALVRGLPGC